MGRTPKGPFPGNYPSRGPSASARGASSSQGPPPSSQAPSSSRGPSLAPSSHKGKKGKLDFIAQGLFACFNVCRHNAERMHEHEKRVDEALLKLEKRQKELLDKSEVEHSPVREPWDIPPPPTFYNPWEEMGSSSQAYTFGATVEIEEDLGGREGNDEEDTEVESEGGEEEGETETESDEDGDDDNNDGDDE